MTKCPTCGAVTEAPRYVLREPEATPEMKAVSDAFRASVEATVRHKAERIEAALAYLVSSGLSLASMTRHSDQAGLNTVLVHDGDPIWRGGYERDGLTMRWAEEWMIPR